MKESAVSTRSKPQIRTSKFIFRKRRKNGKVHIEISKRAAFLMAMLFMIAAAAGRLGQYMTDIDPKTGMFASSYDFMSVYRAVMLGGCAIIALLVVLGRESDKVIKTCILINPYRLRSSKLAARHPKRTGIVSMLMGIAVLAECVFNAKDIIKEYYSDGEFHLDGVGRYRLVMMAVLFITAFIFFSVSNAVLSDKPISRFQAGMMCIPAIYKCMEALLLFASDTILDMISENILLAVLYASSAAFYLSFARIFLGYEKRSTRMIYMMTGYLSAVMAAASVIPRLVMYFIAGYSQADFIIRPQPTDFVMLLLPFAFLDVFWGTYEYVSMPKVSTSGRKWTPAKNQTIKAKKKII